MSEVSGVALEIERKFLLRSIPDVAYRSEDYYFISHGWIPGQVIHERISYTSRDGGEYWRVVKTGKGLTRIEAQERISKELCEQLWSLTVGKRVHKVRYKVQDVMGQVWEIDNFTDRPLFLAEIELKSQDEKVVVPSWLTPHVIQEVTDDPAFLNINLAK